MYDVCIKIYFCVHLFSLNKHFKLNKNKELFEDYDRVWLIKPISYIELSDWVTMNSTEKIIHMSNNFKIKKIHKPIKLLFVRIS
jgi:hypothetical protein